VSSRASLPKGWTLDSAREAGEACPNLANHAREPSGYCTWFDWAASLHHCGYVQSRCPGCGFYVIWTSTFRSAGGTTQDEESGRDNAPVVGGCAGALSGGLT
jgi:hypothetical protein